MIKRDFLKEKFNFLKNMGQLTKVYWRSEEKWRARFLLAIIILLNLGDVYILVLLNEWNNTFYNALQRYTKGVFFSALGSFALLATIYIIISVYEQYFQQMLEIRWRSWMTEHSLQKWLGKQSYYRLQIANSDNKTDNPDQRISEDVRLFVSSSLNLALGFLKAAVTLGSFIIILWRLSGTLSFRLGQYHMMIPGYMVGASIIYAALGTWFTSKIGRPLVKLNFEQQRYEADFRFSLVRLRENSESVAFYRGEEQEKTNFSNNFKKVFINFRKLMQRQKKLTWFTSGYSQFAIIAPFLIGAPRYFSRQIQLGGLIQIASAFGRVQDSLSFFVNSYSSLAEWQAVTERLAGFNRNIELIHNQRENSALCFKESQLPSLAVMNLQIGLPNQTRLIDNLQFELKRGDSLLITGASGTGKSTLIRTLAGLWPFAEGRINIPPRPQMLFLPQKPYLPLGTLRDALFYPSGAVGISEGKLKEIMTQCKLGDFTDRLDKTDSWSHILSLGEQQRVAFARVLIQRPKWLFLDEATSALDEPTEGQMYRMLHEQLPDSVLISVGHRQTLVNYHRLNLYIAGMGQWTLRNTAISQNRARRYDGNRDKKLADFLV